VNIGSQNAKHWALYRVTYPKYAQRPKISMTVVMMGSETAAESSLIRLARKGTPNPSILPVTLTMNMLTPAASVRSWAYSSVRTSPSHTQTKMEQSAPIVRPAQRTQVICIVRKEKTRRQEGSVFAGIPHLRTCLNKDHFVLYI